MLRQTLAVALVVTSPQRITLLTELDRLHRLFLTLADRHGITLRAQPEADLGEHMHYALQTMGEPGL